MTSPPPAPAFPGLPDAGPLTVLEALAAAACLVPPGRAVSYGALAGLLGRGGPRQAGRAMAESPEGTPWWRVVRADGCLPAALAARAAVEHVREGTPLRDARGGPARVDLARAAWDPRGTDATGAGGTDDDGDPAAVAILAALAARVDAGGAP